jgi:hypothetical protein
MSVCMLYVSVCFVFFLLSSTIYLICQCKIDVIVLIFIFENNYHIYTNVSSTITVGDLT